MNKKFLCCKKLVCFFLFAVWLCPCEAAGEKKDIEDIRPAAKAGTWYPGSKDTLTGTVRRLLEGAEPRNVVGTIKAIIVPHAGYIYSGGVAAHAYRLIRGRQFKRVILVGPSHHMRFEGASVNLQSAYKTPLGIVPVDQEMGRKLLNASPHIRWIRAAHTHEHSLELQLPFLITVLKDFKIIPIIMGHYDYDTCLNIANTLVSYLGEAEDTLLLASSDLSHFYSYTRARALDLKFIDRVRAFDPQGLYDDLVSGKCEACGGGPVITILLAARKMGADRAVILKYANSGDVTGDHHRVVGYLSSALIRSSDTGPRQK